MIATVPIYKPYHFMFYFLFCLEYVLSLWFLAHRLFRSILFNFLIFGGFPDLSLLYVYHLASLKEHTLYNVNLLNTAESCFCLS